MSGDFLQAATRAGGFAGQGGRGAGPNFSELRSYTGIAGAVRNGHFVSTVASAVPAANASEGNG
jgi:hypothetical protein